MTAKGKFFWSVVAGLVLGLGAILLLESRASEQMLKGQNGYTKPAVEGTDYMGLASVQRARVQSDASGNLTWTYPVAFPNGSIPIIAALPEGGTSVLTNIQIVGTPTNTSTTFKVLQPSGLTILGLQVLGPATGIQAYLHVFAVVP